MQHRYAGDVGDYSKLGLLRILTSHRRVDDGPPSESPTEHSRGLSKATLLHAFGIVEQSQRNQPPRSLSANADDAQSFEHRRRLRGDQRGSRRLSQAGPSVEVVSGDRDTAR
jgi:hypothetical protein